MCWTTKTKFFFAQKWGKIQYVKVSLHLRLEMYSIPLRNLLALRNGEPEP